MCGEFLPQLENPAEAPGLEEDQLMVFRQVRDEITEMIGRGLQWESQAKSQQS
jgi:hypothetical protein